MGALSNKDGMLGESNEESELITVIDVPMDERIRGGLLQEQAARVGASVLMLIVFCHVFDRNEEHRGSASVNDLFRHAP